MSSEFFNFLIKCFKGSALLTLPLPSISLEEKSSLIKKLSLAGATIDELNIVRTSLSQVKGGKLAAMARNANRVISLVVSDVIGDPLEIIASGPTVPCQKPSKSPREILEKFNLLNSLPFSITEAIQLETSSEPVSNSEVYVIGNNQVAVDAAMESAKGVGFQPVFLSKSLQGNVAEVSEAFFKLAKAIKDFKNVQEFTDKTEEVLKVLSAQPTFVEDLKTAIDTGKKICVVSSGEPTVIYFYLVFSISIFG